MIHQIYRQTEKAFEKLASIAMAVLGNAILGFTFLSLFIIQKSFNRFSASLHLKVNELVSSHEPASNTVINLTEKTEHEINKLTEEYHEKIK
ncbi:MAG TPA: low affinity iron permease family protein [Cyclobacteriaceae bacterium]|jgi:low affinity Fe/Cu permease|nr:low affinity iron permease family protein [Cyclobacteriaceae bacterium]